MDETKLSEDRLAVLRKIEEYERQGRFDEDVEEDPEAPELLPEKVDYLCKKLSSKIARRIANFLGDHYFLNLIKKDILVIDGITGEEHLSALQNGAIVTCNHFRHSIIISYSTVFERRCRGNTSIRLSARGITRISPACTDFCSVIATPCPFRATAAQ